MLPVGEIEKPPAWMDNRTGPVVVSTRVRLARNLHGAMFTTVASVEERLRVVTTVESAASAIPASRYSRSFRTDVLSRSDRQALHERHLVPKTLLDEDKPSALLLSQDEGDAIVINEEDHVRLQALRPGLAAEEAWDAVDAVDDLLDGSVEFAFDSELGYLTACPTNVGTGLRVSVMMHLPALVISGRFANVTAAVIQGGFTVRGMHGEGSDPAGYFFQVSNQRTLGRSEGHIVGELAELVAQIEAYETRSRKKLMDKEPLMLKDRISRCRAVLDSAAVMGSTEAIGLLSILRFGIGMGLVQEPALASLDHLIMLVQPGHMQTIFGGSLSETERDARRPELVRKHLAAVN
ncbi:MAG: ATP--guanido phosphotransferase [Planctomycetes bacterium]|nr:ATP--guanido phosphotransferase [Planctomycetota bacterium]